MLDGASMSAANQPSSRDESLAKLRVLRDEFAARTHDRAPVLWGRLPLELRTILLLLAGIDAAAHYELSALAARDWREFSPPEQALIRSTGLFIRWQLNGARELFQ